MHSVGGDFSTGTLDFFATHFPLPLEQDSRHGAGWLPLLLLFLSRCTWAQSRALLCQQLCAEALGNSLLSPAMSPLPAEFTPCMEGKDAKVHLVFSSL